MKKNNTTRRSYRNRRYKTHSRKYSTCTHNYRTCKIHRHMKGG